MFCLCFVCVLFVFRLCFFYVCQNPKILFSQNRDLRLLPDASAAQTKRMSDICETCGMTSVSHWLQVCTRFGFQIGNCLTQGGRPTHVSHMLQISHTCFAYSVSLMFQLYSIYVSFAYPHMFRLCFTYVFIYA